jgi:hypothetical protein
MSHDKSSMYGKQLWSKVGRYTFHILKIHIFNFKFWRTSNTYVCVNVYQTSNIGRIYIHVTIDIPSQIDVTIIILYRIKPGTAILDTEIP